MSKTLSTYARLAPLAVLLAANLGRASIIGGVDYTITPTSLIPIATGFTGTGFALSWVSGNGTAVGYESTPSNATGRLAWVANANGTDSYIGLGTIDSADYESSTSGSTLANSNPLTDGLTNPVTFTTIYGYGPNAVNVAGDIAGLTQRYKAGTYLGQDAWVYTAGSTASSGMTVTVGSATVNVLTPTVVNPGSTLTDSNGITSTYYYNVTAGGTTEKYRIGTIVGVNDSGLSIGFSNRYTGTTATNGVGYDVWLNNGNGNTTLLGLGVSNNATGYSTNTTVSGTAYLTRTVALIGYNLSGTPIAGLAVPGASSINDAGTVVGNENRYPTGTTPAGTDSWMYTAGSTYEIGLIGSNAANPISFEGVNGVGALRGGLVSHLSGTNEVAGTTIEYKTGLALSVGTVAWLYQPSATPGTATSFGTSAAGTYTQIGLLDSSPSATASATNMGHISGTGVGASVVLALSDSGKAAGQSTRFVTGSNTTYGTSAYYFNGTTSINLEPGNSAITTQTYVGNTLTASANVSNYVNSNYTLTQTVTAMNTSGNLVGGILTRYSPGTVNSAGSDSYIYDGTTNTEYVLESPSVTAPTSYGNLVIKAISPVGVVSGYYVNYSGTTSATATGTYLFEWSEAMGLVTIDQVITGTSTVYSGLNDALADQTGWSALNTTTSSPLVLDNNGNLYGLGNTGAVSSTPTGAWEISATPVPEPASLLVLAMAGIAVLRRRKNSIA